MELVIPTAAGLFCSAGDFYVDPWDAVDRALVTHGHSDHARFGSRHYLAEKTTAKIMRKRLGAELPLREMSYGETVTIGDVDVSFHPAGHILGSAQVRIEHRGHVTVISGDYKLQVDPTCAPFEPLRCNTFVTESTFGLPVYRWPSPESVFGEINTWWRENHSAGRNSVIFAYSLGKAQRVLAGVDSSIGPILGHGAIVSMTRIYQEAEIPLPPMGYVDAESVKAAASGALIVTPPSALGSTWLRRLRPFSTGIASGWMRVRGQRRRRAVDRGFVLSDHADWDDLLRAVNATGAETVLTMHGYADVLARWLSTQGVNSRALPTRYAGDEMEDAAEPAPPDQEST